MYLKRWVYYLRLKVKDSLVKPEVTYSTIEQWSFFIHDGYKLNHSFFQKHIYGWHFSHVVSLLDISGLWTCSLLLCGNDLTKYGRAEMCWCLDRPPYPRFNRRYKNTNDLSKMYSSSSDAKNIVLNREKWICIQTNDLSAIEGALTGCQHPSFKLRYKTIKHSDHVLSCLCCIYFFYKLTWVWTPKQAEHSLSS